MDITEQLLLDLEFTKERSLIDKTKKWYTLYVVEIGFISLVVEPNSDVYYCYFHKNKDDEKWNIIDRAKTSSDLMNIIIRAVARESIKVGKELKQQEIKSVLGMLS